MVIQPIDNFIREGFSKQMLQQFRCPAYFITGPDPLAELKIRLSNTQPKYPYLFLAVTGMSASAESYHSHRISRQGIPLVLNTDNNQTQMARIIPTNFEVECTFITNKHSGGLDSVEGFARRWLFARRIGSLNFNVQYGLSSVNISYVLNEQVSTPPRESPVDQEPVYKIQCSATIRGYVSEPELGHRGRVNQVLVLSDEAPPGDQVFKFLKEPNENSKPKHFPS